ncbi:hypothetical protein SNEBB_005362 [Seison nebaliae]|nr:hypothetical protein SNEBB_005362 [Seison nebaliae]
MSIEERKLFIYGIRRTNSIKIRKEKEEFKHITIFIGIVDICELVVDRTMGPNRGTSDAYRHRSRCGDGSKNNTARNKEKQRMKRRKANRLGLPSPLVFKQSNGSYNHSR